MWENFIYCAFYGVDRGGRFPSRARSDGGISMAQTNSQHSAQCIVSTTNDRLQSRYRCTSDLGGLWDAV